MAFMKEIEMSTTRETQLGETQPDEAQLDETQSWMRHNYTTG